ncbi:hypothetical protein Q2T40_18010 [Winogradskyella maritima]|uniref:Uncharacterized protein n=1 Tax=Winogradskyella maritima TaxID=1517766 RepID=A0ABV8AI96_9FLAO|nr:hypothetical protein [Winogradskyella maritima]
MKFLFSLFALMLVVKECDSNKKEQLNDEVKASSKIEQMDNLIINYTMQSRGMYEAVTITNETIKVSGRDESNSKASALPEAEWQRLQQLVSQLNLEKLSQLKAPTDKRLYDGAPMATLKLERDGKSIETPTFDHGHPPAMIEDLVNKVLSLKETATKD